MKAAVLREFGRPPRYEEFPEPDARPGELRLKVRASALTRLARGVAAGHHYAAPAALPAILGTDGVGELEDGRRVYTDTTRAPYGMMAERAVAPAEACIPLPDGIDDASAAALPNAAISSWKALVYRAQLRPGESVLILGATGVAGGIAVRVARHLGARRVVAAGRNPEALEGLRAVGASSVVSLDQPDPSLREALGREAAEGRFDVILDYLWGHPAEVVVASFTGRGPAAVVPRTRYVTIGSMAGPTAVLPSAAFRSSGLELHGSGIGSVPSSADRELLPKIFDLARQGGLPIATEPVPLAEVAEAWDRPESGGRRRVFLP